MQGLLFVALANVHDCHAAAADPQASQQNRPLLSKVTTDSGTAQLTVSKVSSISCLVLSLCQLIHSLRMSGMHVDLLTWLWMAVSAIQRAGLGKKHCSASAAGGRTVFQLPWAPVQPKVPGLSIKTGTKSVVLKSQDCR